MNDIALGLGLGLGAFAFLYVCLLVLKNFLYICKPTEVLVFEGRPQTLPDGNRLQYTVIHAGIGIRKPFIENVRRLDLSTMTVDIHVANAYSRGNIPLSIHAIANVKICNRAGVIDNALERFLGRDRGEISQVAKETIEGALRGVLARLTPEQVNEERATFTQELTSDVEDDLNRLGLTIDTLNIQSVTDNANYLDRIGRSRIAEVLRDAEVAESNNRREAEQRVAEAMARGQVAREHAQANIQRAENDLRRVRADLEARARSAEETTEQAAFEARARAEVALQEVRAEMERLRLQADEVLPAEAQKIAAQLAAEGESSSISAQGNATAQALRMMTEAWSAAGANAEDIFLLQQLEPLMLQVAERLKGIRVHTINLVDGGDGATLGQLAGAYPAMVASVFESVEATTGINIREILARRGNAAPAVAAKPAAAGGSGGSNRDRMTERRSASEARAHAWGRPSEPASTTPASPTAPADAAAATPANPPAERAVLSQLRNTLQQRRDDDSKD